MCQSATVEGATSQHARFMVMESRRKLNSFLSLSPPVHLPSTFFPFSYLSLRNFFFGCFCLLRPLAFVCIAMALSVTLRVALRFYVVSFFFRLFSFPFHFIFIIFCPFSFRRYCFRTLISYISLIIPCVIYLIYNFSIPSKLRSFGLLAGEICL
jgi:hypothetical protein